MNKCLLCQESIHSRQTFSEIFFIQKQEGDICKICQNSFQKISPQHCSRCFKEGAKDVCQDCLYWEQHEHVIAHESLYQYNEAMAQFFSQYKFQGDYLLRKVFRKDLNQYFKKWSDYTVVPIPISSERMAERGFNQVTGLLEAAGIPYLELLEKQETQKQSEKTRQERLQLEQPFSIKENRDLPDKILLVDDIYTTGATIMLAKEILMKKCKKEIKTFSLAR